MSTLIGLFSFAGPALNALTKTVHDVKTDACIEYGTHVGYNPVSTAGAEQGVLRERQGKGTRKQSRKPCACQGFPR